MQAARQGDGSFEHAVTHLRATATEREERRAFEAEMAEAGYAIYGDRPFVPVRMLLANLRDGDGNELDPVAHAACDGAAVTIGYDWCWGPGEEEAYRAAHGLHPDDEIDADDGELQAAGWRPRWQVTRHLCNDPDAHGHVSVYGSPGAGGEPQLSAQQEADKAAQVTEERRRVRSRNTAWRAATETRQAHLKRLLAGARLPKAMTEAAARLRAGAIARGETEPSMTTGPGSCWR